MSRYKLTVAIIFYMPLWLILITGCQTLGPNAIKSGRPNYDFALQETNTQAMLLNIIRLRYNDVPSFLEITNIYAAPLFEGTASFNAVGIGKGNLYGGGAGLSYSESPVIVYTPLTGRKFANHLLTPIGFKTMALLVNGGWNQDRVFRICIQSINGVSNAENAAGPTPEMAPDYETFKRVSKTLERLENNKNLQMGLVKKEQGGELTEFQIYIDPSVRSRPDVQQLFRDLKLDPEAPVYRVTNAVKGGGNTIAIVTRPLMGAMFYLSKGVQVPDIDAENGSVTVTRGKGGDVFNWSNVIYDIMNIKSSTERPANAFIGTRYRDHWYYISDSDVSSKQTLFLIQTLFILQAGELPRGQAPILTLPVR